MTGDTDATRRSRWISSSRLARVLAGPVAPAVVISVVMLVAYAAWTPTVPGDKDSSELALALATGGAPHPTGYPLYILIGHAFVAVARAAGVGVVHAANLWSAVGGAVAAGLLYLLAARLLPADLDARGRAALALIPVLAFGPNALWTYETTLAEVYAWHVAWALGAVLAFLSVRARLDRGLRDRDAFVWGAVCGLGLAHHATSILVVLPLCVGLALTARQQGVLRGRLVGLALAGACVPLASYGWIAWRAFHPGVWQWENLAPSWSSVIDHVTGAAYRHYLGTFAPSDDHLGLLWRYAFPWLGLALLGSGLAASLARPRSVHGALLACVVLGTTYGFSYGVPDPGSYFLAPIALGLAALPAAGVAVAAHGARLARTTALVGLALTVVALIDGAWGARVAADRRQAFVALEDTIRAMWEAIPYDEAIVLCPGDLYTRLVLYQVRDGEKPGVHVVNPWLLTPVGIDRFHARHGFDPLAEAGLPPAILSDPTLAPKAVDALAVAIHQRSPQPVIVVDLEQGSVRLVR